MKVPHRTSKFHLPLPQSFLKGCFIGLCLALPLLLGAGDISQEELEAHRRQIEEMPASERTQLKNKFKTFRQLTPEKQQELRNIHRMISDEKQVQGKLPRVVENYREWLDTLSPWQREEIRKQQNTTARILLIRKFKKEKEEKNKKRTKHSQDAYTLLRISSRLRQQMRDLPPLDDKDLDSAMRVILAKMEITPSLSRQLKGHPSVAYRYIVTLKALLKSQQQKGTRSRWPDPETILALARVISDTNYHQSLKKIQDIKTSEEQKEEISRSYVNALLLKSILSKWQKEMRQNRPTEDQIAQYFKSLPQSDRNELLEKNPNQVNRILMFEYRMKHDPAMKEMFELRRLMKGGFPFRGIDRSGKRQGNGKGDRGNKRPKHRFEDKKRNRPLRPGN